MTCPRLTKVAAIAVITRKLARFSDPSAEAIVRDMLADAVIARIDTSLFRLGGCDRCIAAGLLMVSLRWLVRLIRLRTKSIACCVCGLVGIRPTSAPPAYYTTRLSLARWLDRDPTGQRRVPGWVINGGTLNGVPVRVSNYLAA